MREDIYRQSGAIPIRAGASGYEVLAITNRSGRQWIFPKGIVEAGMTPGESAMKEAYEEAGVRGSLGSRVGKYKTRKWGGKCRVAMFFLEDVSLLDSWPEDFRKRKWIEVDEQLVDHMHKDLRPITELLPEICAEREQ